MKRVLSVILAVAIIACTIPFSASALDLKTTYPTVYFRGNSEPIVDENGTQVYDFDFDTEMLPDMLKEILPYFAIGLATENFQQYYDAFGREMDKVYDRCQLDSNGDPKYGTGIPQLDKNADNDRMHTDISKGSGSYKYDYYLFANDWRLDPLATADDVAVFIDNILAVTGKDKVNLNCKCLGGDLILAYIAKYGTNKINAIGFGSTVAFGCDIATDVFNGNVEITPDTIERFMADDFIAKSLPEDISVWLELINQTIEMAGATGLLSELSDTFNNKLYKKIFKGLVPQLVRSTYGTWPGYWAMVADGRYESARNFIFGKEGSETYEQYKGLIDKLDNYDVMVRQRIPELLTQAKENGVKLAIVSKYGFQMPPIIKSANQPGDVWTTSRYSSLGGTLADIGTTFSDSYIAEREALGYGQYISPDKMVDASTCLFPESTWFIKGAVHDDWTIEEDRILCNVFNSETQLTVNDMDKYPQFTVYDRATDTVAPMTEENCHTENFEINQKPTIWNKIEKIVKWAVTVITLIIEKIRIALDK